MIKWNDNLTAYESHEDTPGINITQNVHLSLCTIVINEFGRITIYQGKKPLRDIKHKEYEQIRKDVKAVFIEVSEKVYKNLEVGK